MQRVLTPLAFLWFTSVPFIAQELQWIVALGLAAVAVLALRARPPAFHLALLGSAWALCSFLIGGRWWPASLLLGLLLYGTIAARSGEAEFLRSWLRAGRLDLRTGAAVLVIAVGSGLALVLWAVLFDPDWERYGEAYPDLPLAALVAGGVAFSAINAAAEELAFRGVVLEALLRASGSKVAAVILQAVAFGILHIAGFPSGLVGVGLAGLYGLLLGALRIHAGGMLAVWLAHVFADLVIAGLVLAFSGRG